MCVCVSVSVSVSVCAHGRLGVLGWGSGWGSPRDCLRHAKGAPHGDPTLIWFPGSQIRRQPRPAAGVSALATHRGRGWGCGDPRVRPPECRPSGWLAERQATALSAPAARVQRQVGLGAPTALGGGGGPRLKDRRGRKPTAPGIPRGSPTQVRTRPEPRFSSQVRQDPARSGWYGPNTEVPAARCLKNPALCLPFALTCLPVRPADHTSPLEPRDLRQDSGRPGPAARRPSDAAPPPHTNPG